MASLNEKVRQLENQVRFLTNKLNDILKNTEEKTLAPYSKSGGLRSRSSIHPTDIKTGLGENFGGMILWNDAELIIPPYGQQPADPTTGYQKHSHSRYAGGALDINTLELVEYETDPEDSTQIVDANGNPLNKHCQGFWLEEPPIKTSNGVEKIGTLDISFDPATGKWKAGGADYIDVETTYFVQYAYYDGDGNEVEEGTEGATKQIKRDENGNEMKSVLLISDDQFRSNVVWDKDAQVWRMYAVFRPWETEEE